MIPLLRRPNTRLQRLGQDELHHAPGLIGADPARVRMEACARARVVRLYEDGYSRHVGLTGMAFSWKLLVSVVPRASAFDHPPLCGRYGSWFALLRDFGSEAASCQLL